MSHHINYTFVEICQVINSIHIFPFYTLIYATNPQFRKILQATLHHPIYTNASSTLQLDIFPLHRVSILSIV